MDRSGKCHGPCAYPHGSLCTLMYVLATIVAYGLSFYSISSCSFVVIHFTSNDGNFGQLFDSKIDIGTELSEETVGAGLFSWLEPYDTRKWNKGQCSGYSLLAREVIADNTFEAVRVIGIFVVILGASITIWSFVLSCLELNIFQLWLVRILTFMMFVSMNLLHLLQKSALCQKVGKETECKLAQGGVVAIAASIMWFVAFIISVIYFRTIKKREMPQEMNKEEEDERLARYARKMQRREERKRRKQLAEEYALRLQLELVHQGNPQEKIEENQNASIEQQGGSFTDDDTVEDLNENVILAIGQYDATTNDPNTEIIHHLTTEEEFARNHSSTEPELAYAQGSAIASETFNEDAHNYDYLHQNRNETMRGDIERSLSPANYVTEGIVFRNDFHETRAASPTNSNRAVVLKKSASLGVRKELASSAQGKLERSRSLVASRKNTFDEERPSTPTYQLAAAKQRSTRDGRRTPSSPGGRSTPSPLETVTTQSGRITNAETGIPSNTIKKTRARSRSQSRSSRSSKTSSSNSSSSSTPAIHQVNTRSRSASRGRESPPSNTSQENALRERRARSKSRSGKTSPSKNIRERRAISTYQGEATRPYARQNSPEKPRRSRSSNRTSTPHTHNITKQVATTKSESSNGITPSYAIQNQKTSRNRSYDKNNQYSLSSQGIMTKEATQTMVEHIAALNSELYTDEGEVLHSDSFNAVNNHSVVEANPYNYDTHVKKNGSLEDSNPYLNIQNKQDEVVNHDSSIYYGREDARHDEESVVQETDVTSVMTPQHIDVEDYNAYVLSRLKSIDELIDRREPDISEF